MFAFVFDESLFAFAYETPPSVYEEIRLCIFRKHRHPSYFRTPALPAQRFTLLFFLLICLIYGFKGRDAARPAYYAPEGKPNTDVRIRAR